MRMCCSLLYLKNSFSFGHLQWRIQLLRQVYIFTMMSFWIIHMLCFVRLILPMGKELPNGTYRWVCLFEHDSIVNSLVSYEDKISDTIDRLIELLSMNQINREREFQKEFMFYWNSEATNGKHFTVYLSQNTHFSEMEAFHGAKNIRLIEQGLILSDIDDRDKGRTKVDTPP